MIDFRSRFLTANAEITLAQLPESIISLQILPLIVHVEQNNVEQSQDSCVERGKRQFHRRTNV